MMEAFWEGLPINRRCVLALSGGLAAVVLLLAAPAIARAAPAVGPHTDVRFIGPQITVTTDNNPHNVLSFYTSTRDSGGGSVTWAPIVGFLSGAAVVAGEAAAAAEGEVPGIPHPLAQKIIAAALATIVVVGQVASSPRERVLVVSDSSPGATVDPIPKINVNNPLGKYCDKPRIQGSSAGAIWQNKVECPLTGLSKLTVLTGNGADVLDFSSLYCNECFSDSIREIDVHTRGGGDTITGSRYADLLEGGPGNDRIGGGGGWDQIFGFFEDSPFHQLSWRGLSVNSDVQFGEVPATYLPDNDRLYGDVGHDIMSGGPGDDLLDGGPDDEDASASVINDPVLFPDLPLLNSYEMLGGGGEDVLIGGAGHDGMEGGPGRDTVLARESDYGAPDEPDIADCAKPNLGPPLTGPEYYRISKPSPQNPASPTDRLTTCNEELSAPLDASALKNWQPGRRWWWYK